MLSLTRKVCFSSGFVLGGGNALLSGESFWSSAFSGMWQGALSGAVLGGITGGIKAKMHGGSFWDGNIPVESTSPYSVPEWNSPELESIPFEQNGSNSLISKDISNLTPYQKGEMGTEYTDNILRHLGYDTHREISTNIEGITNRWDLFYRHNNVNHFVEVKTGFKANFTTNQRINIPKMINGVPYMFKGGNAMKIPQIQVGTTVNCPGQVTIFRWVF